MPQDSTPDLLASQAEFIVNNLTQTDYQHTDNIVVDQGIYDCDCNGFVGFVLEKVAPNHYAMVPVETDQTRPRAFKYYGFFASLTPESTGGWIRIDALQDAQRGDIIAWRFPLIESDENTGHVLFVAEPPTVDDSGVYAVRVYDSAAEAHFEDTRGDGPGQFPTGVGSGFINFVVDGEGRPIAYLFAPPITGEYEYVQMAIGRAGPL